MHSMHSCDSHHLLPQSFRYFEPEPMYKWRPRPDFIPPPLSSTLIALSIGLGSPHARHLWCICSQLLGYVRIFTPVMHSTCRTFTIAFSGNIAATMYDRCFLREDYVWWKFSSLLGISCAQAFIFFDSSQDRLWLKHFVALLLCVFYQVVHLWYSRSISAFSLLDVVTACLAWHIQFYSLVSTR